MLHKFLKLDEKQSKLWQVFKGSGEVKWTLVSRPCLPSCVHVHTRKGLRTSQPEDFYHGCTCMSLGTANKLPSLLATFMVAAVNSIWNKRFRLALGILLHVAIYTLPMQYSSSWHTVSDPRTTFHRRTGWLGWPGLIQSADGLVSRKRVW